ncbi:MAG TPA: hypothetical protein VHG27_00435, partial [Xanthobacteraceae bacterium]|nr:hypothetical protein [Xanthobacteraceae bacterium]
MQLRQHLFIVFGAIGLVLAFLVSPRLVGQFLAVDRELAHLIHHLRLIVAAMGVTLIACGMVRSSMQPVFFAIPIVSLFLFVIARSMIRGADQRYLLLISDDGP